MEEKQLEKAEDNKNCTLIMIATNDLL